MYLKQLVGSTCCYYYIVSPHCLPSFLNTWLDFNSCSFPDLEVRIPRSGAEVLYVYSQVISKHPELRTRSQELLSPSLQSVYLHTECITLSVNSLRRQASLSYDWKFSEGHPPPRMNGLFPDQQSIESCLFIHHNNLIFRGQPRAS